MYQHILVPVENSAADDVILDHIKPLARMTGARFLLVCVATGWVARNYEALDLADSEEMRESRAYLERHRQELIDDGFACGAVLALGEPADEILRLAREHGVDLIAMSTHGHRFIQDLFRGTTADKVRHLVDIPVLLLKAAR